MEKKYFPSTLAAFVHEKLLSIVDYDHITVALLNKFKIGAYYGIPKFIVEVLSPSTRHKDLTVKKKLYEQHRVGEYWIVDYRAESVDIYQLVEGKYELVQAYMLQDDVEAKDYNAEDILSLRKFPNIQIKLKDIFE